MTSIHLLLIVSCLFVLICCGEEKDYYAILGVSRKATKREIKKAYKKLAIQWHPDRVSAEMRDEAHDKFVEISNAYEVLSDEKKRQIYDRYGEEGLKNDQGRGFNFGDPGSIFRSFFGGSGSSSPFGSFFGGGDDSDDSDFGMEDEFRGPDLHIPLAVTLEDLYVGKVLSFTRIKKGVPEDQEPKKCRCRNSGVFRIVVENGRPRRIQDNNCAECKNRFKVETQESDLLVDILPGTSDGERFKFYSEGDASTSQRSGDLILELRQLPHSTFVREGDDLKMVMKISLKDALAGFRTQIKQLDGRAIEFASGQYEVIRHGHVKTIKGEGMPRRNDVTSGDLHITFEVEFPTTLSLSQKAQIATIL